MKPTSDLVMGLNAMKAQMQPEPAAPSSQPSPPGTASDEEAKKGWLKMSRRTMTSLLTPQTPGPLAGPAPISGGGKTLLGQ